MNNLKTAYQNDPQTYKEILLKLAAELNGCLHVMETLYQENRFDELRPIVHNVRNIAGAAGQTKLKIVAAYWEELCVQKKSGPINEFRQSIEEAARNMQKEAVP